MKRAPLTAALVASAAVLLAGCTAVAPDTAATYTATPEPDSVAAEDISTIDEGIAWARSLDSDVEERDLSRGIRAISDLVPEQNIWFETSNDISGDLIGLNADVLANPDDAGSKVDELNEIIDNLEAAMARGDQP